MVYAVILVLWVIAALAIASQSNQLRLLRARVHTVEGENLKLAKSLIALDKRVSEISVYAVRCDEFAISERSLLNADAELAATIEGVNQRLLTLEGKQPKIVPRPKKVNFRQFREAAERASEPKEDTES